MIQKQKLQPFLVRLKPSTRALLDRAADEQGRSRSNLVDEAIRTVLSGRYADVEQRLKTMLDRQGNA
jgi:metal-responsive CopG/Arc/MetJ family transcriptional regulator